MNGSGYALCRLAHWHFGVGHADASDPQLQLRWPVEGFSGAGRPSPRPSPASQGLPAGAHANELLAGDVGAGG